MKKTTLQTPRFRAEIRYSDAGDTYPKFTPRKYGSDADLETQLEVIHAARNELIGEPGFDPRIPSLALGPVLFVGYDCEWVDHSKKNSASRLAR